ncbi:hypothetical protein FH581_004845 [Leptospira weilii]|uniref:hypothetical protein n=1 Tax=Leptospira weilii TaxID=28184 RepID=UPI000248626D|nr:hypothetical protein [Leptospira weilii]UPY78202.1 hypothetical protein FH581_004845 [Leptospira weilii]
MLKYLDPYGDAIFNYLQMPDLITDLRAIPDQDSLILQVIEMAIQCRNGRLRYLDGAPVGDMLLVRLSKNQQPIYKELADEWFDPNTRVSFGLKSILGLRTD